MQLAEESQGYGRITRADNQMSKHGSFVGWLIQNRER